MEQEPLEFVEGTEQDGEPSQEAAEVPADEATTSDSGE